MRLRQDLLNAIQLLRRANIDARDGLPEELFLLISGLTPIPNIDLLITDESERILLSRRNDEFFEKSWHIPGGCIRYGERIEERLQKTALKEIGCEVLFAPVPLAVRSVWRGRKGSLPYPAERGHNIAILFNCRLPEGFILNNGDRTEDSNGFLQWFQELPDDFMSIQHVYDDVLQRWIKKVD